MTIFIFPIQVNIARLNSGRVIPNRQLCTAYIVSPPTVKAACVSNKNTTQSTKARNVISAIVCKLFRVLIFMAIVTPFVFLFLSFLKSQFFSVISLTPLALYIPPPTPVGLTSRPPGGGRGVGASPPLIPLFYLTLVIPHYAESWGYSACPVLF